MAVDLFGKFYSHLDSPAEGAFEITPEANTEAVFDTYTRSIYVGNGGDVEVLMVSNVANTAATVTFTNVQSGTILPVRAACVYATGTTANSLIGLY
jgi:hypothetical protein